MSDKQKVSAILSVILTAVVALLAVFGYHVTIVTPEITALEAATLGEGRAPALTLDAGACACPCATPLQNFDTENTSP